MDSKELLDSEITYVGVHTGKLATFCLFLVITGFLEG